MAGEHLNLRMMSDVHSPSHFSNFNGYCYILLTAGSMVTGDGDGKEDVEMLTCHDHGSFFFHHRRMKREDMHDL